MATVANKADGEVLLHFVANSGTIVIAGNNSVSNVSTGANETVNGATIAQVTWGVANNTAQATGGWVLKRGANTVAVLSGCGQMDFAGAGMALKLYPAADFSANLVGTDTGFIMVELQKDSTLAVDDYLKN